MLCFSCRTKILDFYTYYLQALRNIKNFEIKSHEIQIKNERESLIQQNLDFESFKEIKIEKIDVFAEPFFSETSSHENFDTKQTKNKIKGKFTSKPKCEVAPTLHQSIITIDGHQIIGRQTNERYPSGRYKFSYNCPLCSKAFHSKSGLKYHLRTHLIGDDIEIYKCDLCGKTTRDKCILKSHMQNIHMEKLMCHQCSKGFGTRYALKIHMLRHDPSNKKSRKREDGTYNPYVCDMCSKSFVRITSLRYHVERVHLEKTDKIYICDVCGKNTGSTKSSLTQHINIHHTERKREQCEICNRLVISTKRHYKLVHETTGVFTCTKCGKQLRNEKQLAHHVRMRHPDQTQQHVCNDCGKIYKHRHLMMEHIHATHSGSGSYLYQCSYCIFEVNYKRNLLAHYRKFHKELYAVRQLERREQLYGSDNTQK